jgi:SH3-like domain-containing protein
MRFSLVFIVALCFTEPAFAQARFPYTAETVSDRVNVRAGQNNNFESVALLPKGAAVIVLGKTFNWFKVFLPDGSRAFVKAQYVKFLTPEIGEVLVDHLNVRAAPNTEATTVGQLKRSQRFFIAQRQGDWVWIKPADGVYGWVNDALLVFKNNAVSEPSRKDPGSADAVKESVSRAAQAKAQAKIELLTKLAGDMVECSGRLVRVEAVPAAYKVTRGDNRPVCYVDAPAAILDGFVGSNVRVKGALKSVPAELDAGVVSLSKINLDL